LSTTTLSHHSDMHAQLLAAQMENIEANRAYSDQTAGLEQEVLTLRAQVVSLNQQLAASPEIKVSDRDTVILCVIDGNTNLFVPELLADGVAGGRRAAQSLAIRVAEHLNPEGFQSYRGVALWVTLYVNKAFVGDTLADQGICSRQQLEDFLAGFSECTRFSVVDVGFSANTSSKIIETLNVYIRMPHVLRIIVGPGLHLQPYAAVFGQLQDEHLIGKALVLHTTTNHALLDVPELDCVSRFKADNVFVAQDLLPKRLSPLSMPGGIFTPVASTRYSGLVINGGLASPQSPRTPRLIDPSLPLHKQNPPPCNEHYLMRCTKGPSGCKYGHDYVLTPEQLDLLAANAKKAPCNWLKNSLQCPFGDACCWGHVCPNGPSCFHLSKGKCWFKG
ncbi:hypothetical protein FISHEDRAFT_25691, partial [Fistulina hepatica ATCC 64428]